ncbi:MAG TPA: hypothetical protein PLX89_21785 [Verrucomicrobiota bacterium]|nr:hypothetical protein [Verrucomicrobiota bacterium]
MSVRISSLMTLAKLWVTVVLADLSPWVTPANGQNARFYRVMVP